MFDTTALHSVTKLRDRAVSLMRTLQWNIAGNMTVLGKLLGRSFAPIAFSRIAR